MNDKTKYFITGAICAIFIFAIIGIASANWEKGKYNILVNKTDGTILGAGFTDFQETAGTEVIYKIGTQLPDDITTKNYWNYTEGKLDKRITERLIVSQAENIRLAWSKASSDEKDTLLGCHSGLFNSTICEPLINSIKAK